MTHLTNHTSPRTNGFIAGVFMFAMIFTVGAVVSDTTEPVEVAAQDSGGGGGGGGNSSGTFEVNTKENSAGVSLSASRDQTTVYDGPVTMTWSTSNADDPLTASSNLTGGLWSGSKNVNNSSSQTDTVDFSGQDLGTYTLELEAQNSGNGSTQTAEATVEVVPQPPQIDEFEIAGQNADASSGDTLTYELDLNDDVGFELVWETTKVDRVESRSNPELDQWQNGEDRDKNNNSGHFIGKGNEDVDDPGLINLYNELLRTKTYNFTLTAFNKANDSVSKYIDAVVTDPPTLESLQFAAGSPTRVELDGEPGSVATTTLAVQAHKLPGLVELSAALPGDLGEKVEVSFKQVADPELDANPLDFGAFPASYTQVNKERTAVLVLEVDQPIYDDENGTITITADSEDPDVDEADLPLDFNVEGFQPRTIEEF